MVKAFSAVWRKIKNSTSPSFTTNVLARTIWETSLTFFGVIFSIIIARCLGPYGKGVINTIDQFGALAGLFVSPGLYSALQYFIASRKCTIKEGIPSFIFFTLVYSFPLTFLILFLSPYFAHNILKGVPLHLLTVYIIFFLLSTYFAPTSIVFSALQRFPQSTFIGIVQLFSKLLLLILFLVLFKMDVWGAFLPDWLLSPLGICLSFYFLQDVLKISFFKPSLNKALLKGLLNYGLKVFMIGLLGRIVLRVDVFFVNYYQSPTAVGLYMTGVSYTEFIRLIPSAVGTALFPRVSATREGEAKNLTTLITRTYIIFIPLLGVFLLLLAHFIIPFFYGARFIPSISVVGYLLPGVIALCFGSPLGEYLNGRGHPEFNLYSSAIGVILTLFGDFFLISRMGIKGAALVSSIAYIATFLLLLHFFCSYTKASLKEIFFPRREDMLYILQVLKEKLAGIRRKELK